MAKVKHTLRGYTSPKPFETSETDRCIAYDERVVDEWLRELSRYGGGDRSLEGQSVLELGPGSDLGVGLLLLAHGASRYSACDVNNLVARAPQSFYDALFAKLAATVGEPQVRTLHAELDRQRSGQPSQLNYVVQPDFDLVAAVGRASIDRVFSQAAFEHFEDIGAVVRQLTEVCRPGATIVAEIDLKTHSRWIRDKDPNNIYRYSDSLYRTFWFRGIPNRVRPHEYRAAFERCGWGNIQVHALALTDESTNGTSGLDKRFQGAVNEMDHLSIMFCATRGG